ncbi:uncharacterized protein BDZ99DRAFT_459972 [Mytilinidion resinicola]|uniref:Uncharacterized protein n=1 Tax=Mytilinidion resinicola TaxID=574789 RepID=A0A6A6Z0F1_9PEZI|nr:uncharacterized protein BDZ99DRAFT_459972 [Mytilinidion resinicola]KAF2814268.1 hypothetical protein BDZ99DRAFT_459972 [Mytilinidion resinicola]
MAHQPQKPSSTEASWTVSESTTTMDQSSTKASHDDASTAATSLWASPTRTPSILLTAREGHEQDIQILGNWLEDVEKDSDESEDGEVSDGIERRNDRGSYQARLKEDTSSFQIITSGLDVGCAVPQTGGYDYYGICDVMDAYADASKPGAAMGKEGVKVVDEAKRMSKGKRGIAHRLTKESKALQASVGRVQGGVPTSGYRLDHDELERLNELLQQAANETTPEDDRSSHQPDPKVAPAGLTQKQTFRDAVRNQFGETYELFKEYDERIKALERHAQGSINRSNHWFRICIVLLMVGFGWKTCVKFFNPGVMG